MLFLSGVAMAAWASSCGDFVVLHECLGFPESPETQNSLCSCYPLAYPEQMCPGTQLLCWPPRLIEASRWCWW